MFHKSIAKLQAIRKFVDYKAVELADYPLLSQKLEDCSVQITMCITDLVNSDKIIRTIPQEEQDKWPKANKKSEANTSI